MKTLCMSNLVFALFLQFGFTDETPTPNSILLTLAHDAQVYLKGSIAPIESTQYNFHETWETLANLQVSASEKHYPVSVFQAFLPTQARLHAAKRKLFLQELKRLFQENPTRTGNDVSVGEIWQIGQDGVLELLKQLHPNPSLDMHINSGDSRGAWACLRAYNDKFADIVFRIHAEFVFQDGWFTPSQFTGHLIIDRTHKTVAYFHMYVPKDTLNFHVNRPYHIANSSLGTDVGFCPQIELVTGAKNTVHNIQFSESITLPEAKRALMLRFYKSQHINWVSVDEALQRARTQQKPIHIVSTDGPLNNEVCTSSGKSLRAVALSDDSNIKFLNANFINTWILNTNIERLREEKGTGEMSPLTRKILWSRKRHSPVDCLVISPQLQLMGRQPVKELSQDNRARMYQLFLEDALEGKRPGVGEKDPIPLSSNRSVVLNRIQPTIEVLDTFRTTPTDSQDYTVVKINATAFKNGGTLTIDIQVGRSPLIGSFDLFDANVQLSSEGTPHGALAHAWGIQPGKIGTIIYPFDKGQIFQLGATGGWVSETGSANAFRARISIQ